MRKVKGMDISKLSELGLTLVGAEQQAAEKATCSECLSIRTNLSGDTRRNSLDAKQEPKEHLQKDLDVGHMV